MDEKYKEIHPQYFELLGQWQDFIIYPAIGSIAIGILVYILYKIKFSSLKTFKEKFDFASQFESKKLFQVHVAIAIALFFFVNWLKADVVVVNPVWFAIRAFIGICVGVLYGYIALLLLKYYYPKPLHKKLKKLRYTPRTNPKTGNKMKLLSEEEEDVYLDEGKQAEENVFSVDYDVWIDEESGDTIIEKYDGRLSAEECDRCGFRTLKLESEKITKPATSTEEGELEKEFKCGYCSRVKRRTVKISTTMEKDASAGTLIADPLANEDRIVLVKVDIKSSSFNLLSFEFQSIKEALKNDDLKAQQFGIESVKVEIYKHNDEQVKFQFQNMDETRRFLEQFNLHNVD